MTPPLHHLPSPETPRRPSGFTLVELMVVMGIIALLASMALVAYGRVGETARIAGTKTLIKQLDSNLQERVEALRRYDFGPLAQSFFRYSGTQQQYEPVAWLRKITYRGEFPQRIQDLYGFDGLHGDGNPAEQRDNSPLLAIIQKRTGKTSAALEGLNALGEPEISSAELLYLALTEASSYGLPPLDLELINGQYITDSDNDGLPEFVDGWGQPLRFYNFPTSLLRPSGNTAMNEITVRDYNQAKILVRSLPPLPLNMAGTAPRDLGATEYDHPLNIDPHDYLGLLAPSITNFEPNWHARDTFFVPLIVSAGPDQSLGMYEPWQTAFDMADDHSSHSGKTASQYRNGLIKLAPDPMATPPNVPVHPGLYDNLTNYQRGGF